MSGTILAGASILATPAQAQDSGNQTAPPSGNGTQDIVVTAQFREQNLQDTPIAITAFTGQALEQRGSTSLTDTAAAAPSVVMRPAPGNFGSSIQASIRGLGQIDFSPALEPGVGLYIDDVYYPRLTGANFDLLDVGRVEILRGPQGTLTGKNSEGGAIKFISRKPTGDGGGYISATYGSRNRINLRGSADFTIAENLYGRLSGTFADQDGYVDVLDYGCANPSSGVPATAGSTKCVKYKQGDVGYQALRGMLRFNPDDRLDIIVSGDYIKDKRHAAATVLTYANNANPNVLTSNGLPLDSRFICGQFCNYTTMGQPAANFIAGLIPALDGMPLAASSGSEWVIYEAWGFSGNIEYKLNEDIKLTSISAYRQWTNDFSDDNDLAPTNVTFGNYALSDKFFSQELRLNASLGEKVDLTVGGYYSHENTTMYTLQDFRYIATDIAGVGLLPIYPLQFIGNDPIVTKSEAIYSTVVFRPADSLTLTGGLRYTKDDKKYTFFRHNYDGVTLNPFLPFNDVTGSFAGDRIDYRISADYRISPEVLFYATISTGYKAGGVNPRPFNVDQVRGFGPEKVRSYEIGAKTDLLDRRLRVNVAAFYQNFKDAQLTLLTCPQYGGPGPCALPQNAGDASMKGVEVELFAKPVDGLQIDGSLSYLKWDWKCVNPAVVGLTPGACSSDSDVINLLSSTPRGVMKWKWSAGIQYDADLGDFGRLTPRVDVDYQGSMVGSDLTPTAGSPSDLYGQVPSYTLVNANLTWRNQDNDLSVTLSVLNVFDKYYYTSTFDQVASGAGIISASPGRPREWSVSMKKSF